MSKSKSFGGATRLNLASSKELESREVPDVASLEKATLALLRRGVLDSDRMREELRCYKAHTNFPGYDLMAVNPVTWKIARVQVKSRWATNYGHAFHPR